MKFESGDKVKLNGLPLFDSKYKLCSDYSHMLKEGVVYTILKPFNYETSVDCYYIEEEDGGDCFHPSDIFELVTSPAEEFNTHDEHKALRYNTGKPNWSLIHYKSLEPLVKVLMMGAEKYAPDNWKKGFNKKELLDSAMRHMVALMDGEENDPESGLSHSAHVMCNMMFYSYHFVINKDHAGDIRETQPD